jgi:hypothetical protein
MLHIATVHWKDDRWIDIQLKYLRLHISREFKVYAFLHQLSEIHRPKYFYSSTEPVRSHAVKLNLLADMAAFNAASPDDWLMFIDGDAFPIGDVVPFACAMFKHNPLIAIQRRENNGDVQPHPSFCLTTVGFWKSIGGDWKEGHQWRSAQGKLVTDIGGNLLGILEQRHIEWHPMLRSNQRNLHPLLFGLYDDVIYHHGSGFGIGSTRARWRELKENRKHRSSRMIDGMFNLLPTGGTLGNLRMTISPKERALRNMKARDERLSHEVFESIQRDVLFYRTFQ